MTHRDQINAFTNKQMVKFMLRRGCCSCPVNKTCPDYYDPRDMRLFKEPEKKPSDGLACGDRLLTWLEQEV